MRVWILTSTIVLLLAFQNCSQSIKFGGDADRREEIAASLTDGPTDPNNLSDPANKGPKTCLFNGVTYDDGAPIETFKFESVSSTQSCEKETRVCKDGLFTGSFTYFNCTVMSAPPPQFTLTHNPNERVFKISTMNVSVDSPCKIQYEKNGSTWTDLIGGNSVSCTNGFTNFSVQFPAETDWTNNFDATGVKVRMIKASDSTVVGVFAQTAKCWGTSGSITPTPDFDENCNSKWDDTTPKYGYCKVALPDRSYGANYNCPQTVQCSGKTSNFVGMYWMNLSAFYSDSSCQNMYPGTEYGHSYGGNSQSATGNLPTLYPDRDPAPCAFFGSGNYIKHDPARWSDAECEYAYDDGLLYN